MISVEEIEESNRELGEAPGKETPGGAQAPCDEQEEEEQKKKETPEEEAPPPPPPAPEAVVEEDIEEPPKKKRGRPKAAPKEKPAPKPRGRPRKVQVVEEEEEEAAPVFEPPTEDQLRDSVIPLLRAYATHLHLRGRDAKRARYRSLFSRVV